MAIFCHVDSPLRLILQFVIAMKYDVIFGFSSEFYGRFNSFPLTSPSAFLSLLSSFSLVSNPTFLLIFPIYIVSWSSFFSFPRDRFSQPCPVTPSLTHVGHDLVFLLVPVKEKKCFLIIVKNWLFLYLFSQCMLWWSVVDKKNIHEDHKIPLRKVKDQATDITMVL